MDISITPEAQEHWPYSVFCMSQSGVDVQQFDTAEAAKASYIAAEYMLGTCYVSGQGILLGVYYYGERDDLIDARTHGV